MKSALSVLILCLAISAQAAPRFEIAFPASAHAQPLDGRVLLVISKSSSNEPRFQTSFGPDTQQIFGIGVDALAPGKTVVIDDTTLGFPIEKLSGIPAGEYRVQAVINIYETFHLSGGRTVKLPPDRGEGQRWNIKPGNLYSEPRAIRIDPAKDETVRIELSKVIPPLEEPKDTKYIKRVRIQSELLTNFWGQPTYIAATVLLPSGFDEHPDAHYPVLYYQGHFNREFAAGPGFRETPPDAGASPGRKAAYEFTRDWISGKLPKVLIVTIQHANPYFDDSYAVNSENVGPYGDAIVKELLPEVEKRFRAIAQPWARALYGGSTGGWEVLAQQVFYPDFYNGAWCFCPDPIDFRAFMTANLYTDKNAYWLEGAWLKVAHPGMRDTTNQVLSTLKDMNHYELVLGTNGRSGEQFDIWQAAFSPPGADGYPQPIYDKRTGAIDPKVADYWKEHYDLSYIMQRDWKTLGPKLTGKLHFTVGDADTFYLDRAVHLLQTFLDGTNADATFDYGRGQPHCYPGTDGLRLNQHYMPIMAERMLATAPPGADTTSWRY